MRDTKNHWWSLWRRYRRQPIEVCAALLLLSVFIIGEPLVCVLHCHLWHPDVTLGDTDAMTMHQHHQRHKHPLALSDASGGVLQASAELRCDVHVPGSGVPLPPSPIHELALPIIALLGVLIVSVSRSVAAPAHISSLQHPPPTPPPIHVS
jgi:hypothetical protein